MKKMNFKMNTKLKQFQTKTVNWMIKQENKNDGGLLMNEPGTGKTICCINLIVKTYQLGQKTLIVCPAGLVSNWVQEIKKHSNISDRQIIVYVGKNRFREDFSDKDKNIVITSYSTISRERSGKLYDIKFSRVILDEGHYIRNSNRNIFKSIMEIKTDLKWIVTATPILNNINDLYSYVRFLELNGIDSRMEWKKQISGQNPINALRNLNKIISQNSMRLKKCDVLKELPEKDEKVINLQMSGFEKDFYDTLWTYSLKRILNMSLRIQRLTGLNDINSKMIKQVLSNNVLVYILRLKQCCNNPWLVIKTMSRLGNIKNIQQATERLAYYNLSESMEEECPICYDNIADSIASPCGHKCCDDCWNKLFINKITKCPKCRTAIESIDKISSVKDKIETKTENENIKRSVKIDKLIEIIKEKIDKNEKIIVVSQWVGMLDIVKEVVDNYFDKKIKHITLQGSISIEKRSELIQSFQNDKMIKICYLSLLSSAEGINLTAANNLVMLDTWWNNGKMIQVCDRIHRIGQTKRVNIYKLMISDNNSIEQKITELVNKKSKITNLVIDKWNIFDTKNYDSSWISNVVKLIDKCEKNT